MTWVKVCGLSCREDVEAAVGAGADAVGFVLIPESPRAITLEKAVELVDLSSITRIILTRDLGPQDLVAAALAVGADGVQPYGAFSQEASKEAAEVGLMVLRPVPMTGVVDLTRIPAEQTPLLDNFSSDRLGGSGRSFDHTLIPATDREYVIAGGLGPDNVRAVIHATRAWGVDASSGLESAPGRKDLDLIHRFVSEARQA
ncbi:MAG TPA: phosphoribosylanthranilate isomerase [Acidimicrobiia bacterium]|nr:phosphoribosylanthranilate isomerase [Acidimicrobiia bacterium]